MRALGAQRAAFVDGKAQTAATWSDARAGVEPARTAAMAAGGHGAMLPCVAVVYRDDRQALSLQVAELERENAELREQVESLQGDARRQRDEERETRHRAGAERGCAMCGGSLLPVALFAGRDLRAPIPIALSTLRFGAPDGGFTRSAPVKAKVCSSCGYIHTFIDIEADGGNMVGRRDDDPR